MGRADPRGGRKGYAGEKNAQKETSKEEHEEAGIKLQGGRFE